MVYGVDLECRGMFRKGGCLEEKLIRDARSEEVDQGTS